MVTKQPRLGSYRLARPGSLKKTGCHKFPGRCGRDYDSNLRDHLQRARPCGLFIVSGDLRILLRSQRRHIFRIRGRELSQLLGTLHGGAQSVFAGLADSHDTRFPIPRRFDHDQAALGESRVRDAVVGEPGVGFLRGAERNRALGESRI